MFLFQRVMFSPSSFWDVQSTIFKAIKPCGRKFFPSTDVYSVKLEIAHLSFFSEVGPKMMGNFSPSRNLGQFRILQPVSVPIVSRYLRGKSEVLRFVWQMSVFLLFFDRSVAPPRKKSVEKLITLTYKPTNKL